MARTGIAASSKGVIIRSGLVIKDINSGYCEGHSVKNGVWKMEPKMFKTLKKCLLKTKYLDLYPF